MRAPMLSVMVSLLAAGCGGAGLTGASRTPAESTSDGQGLASFGQGAQRSRLFMLDADRQRPAIGVATRALALPGGHLVRASNDAEGYEPEMMFIPHGATRTLTLSAANGNVAARVRSLSVAVDDSDYLGEVDLLGVASLSRTHDRSTVMFMSAPADGEEAQARFHVYLSPLPDTLVALSVDGTGRPADGQVLAGTARVVSSGGATRALGTVRDVEITTAAVARRGVALPPPLVTGVRVSTQTGANERTIAWNVEDIEKRVLAWEIGADTTSPARRVPATAQTVTVPARRGRQFVCVRPVFEAGPGEAQSECTTFEAPNASAGPDVRVAIRPLDSSARAVGTPFEVELHIENVGQVHAPAFSVLVAVSRDGSLRGGLGVTRTLDVEGLRPGDKTLRRTQVSAPQDGSLYVVAEAVLPAGTEANPFDNLDRLPFSAAPVGAVRARRIALLGDAGAGRMSALAGQQVTVRAHAEDPELGDVSGTVAWRSIRDGALGVGARADLMLSPGLHRVRSSVPAVGDQQADNAAEVEVEMIEPAKVANSLPTANAGPDLTTTLGRSVVPWARVFDPDGQPLALSWSVVAAPEGSQAKLEDPTSLTPRLLPDVPGRYRLSLVVNDGQAEARDDVEVFVLGADANRPPQVIVKAPDTGAVGAKITVMLELSDPDGDALTPSYRLKGPEASTAVLELGAGQAIFVPDVPGIYIFTAVVSDGRGGSGTAGAQITVK